jgi:hypothetical protein
MNLSFKYKIQRNKLKEIDSKKYKVQSDIN